MCRICTYCGRWETYTVQFYSLDAIIAVGYRVNSKQATPFRIWATKTLKEIIVKGFVLDDDRLKLSKRFGRDYFEELVERIREIRASERRFYLKITDIFEQASIDYHPNSEATKTFFNTKCVSLPHLWGRWIALRLSEDDKYRHSDWYRENT
jgi:hypothetical protein